MGFACYLMDLARCAAAPEREYPPPERIRYDAQCLTIDGKDTLVFSGAFAYFRCPKPLGSGHPARSHLLPKNLQTEQYWAV